MKEDKPVLVELPAFDRVDEDKPGLGEVLVDASAELC